MHLHEILARELEVFGERPLRIIETGTLRSASEDARVGDGWSTVFFAQHVKRLGGELVSIDKNVRTADVVLHEKGLREAVVLVEDHSIAVLARLCTGELADVVLLDSDNDEMLIFHEFLIARTLVKPGGIILVDDVKLPQHTHGTSAQARKGLLVLPYLKELGIPHRTHERIGWRDYRTGVVAVDC